MQNGHQHVKLVFKNESILASDHAKVKIAVSAFGSK
jgi:hypothetical protein